MNREELKLSTGNPQALFNEICHKIDDGKIRSWVYDEDSNISHKGEQYSKHFFFKPAIDKNKGLLKFIFHSDGNEFAESRAFQLLERMLLQHFSDEVEIL
jgi:hypothetical protein